MKKIFLLILLTVLACVGAFGQSESFTVKGYQLNLIERDGKCVVSFTKQNKTDEKSLDIGAPCRFVRMPGNTKAIQSVTYKDLKNATVILVVGGPTSPEQKDSLMPAGCGTQWQAILLRTTSVTVSKVKSGSVLCPSGGADEAMFWTASH